MPDDHGGSTDSRGDTFDVFYEVTAKKVVQAVARMTGGDFHLAEELVQEAYVAMLYRWEHRRCRSREDNRRYVLGIAANKLRDWYRDGNWWDGSDDDGDTPVDDPGYGEVDLRMSLLRATREVLEAQPPRRRAVGVLFFVEEWEYAAIAEALDLSESTVRTHVERLRRQLKPLVARHAGEEELS